MRILIVDDNVDAADSLALLLDLGGHETRTANDGESALVVAEDLRPDLAILDIGLPGMDGHEVARRLRSMPAFASLILVALTGWGTDDDKRKAKEAGFDFHVTKPIDGRAIDDIVARASRSMASPEPRA